MSPTANHTILKIILASTLGLTCLSAHAQTTQARRSTPLRACSEETNFPPYNFSANPAELQRRKGLTIDFLNQLSGHLGQRIELSVIPLGRCLNGVASGQYDFAPDFYFDKARSAKYQFSKPYAKLTPQYFYDQRKFPKGLSISSPADLKPHMGCGIIDYSYEHYGLSESLRFEAGSSEHESLASKLLAGRCDYFVEELEIIQALAANPKSKIAHSAIAHAPVPGASSPSLHIIFAKGNPRMNALAPFIDEAISKFQGH